MNLFAVAFIAGGILLGGLIRFIEFAVKYYLDRNRSWVIEPDGDTGRCFIGKKQLQGNTIVQKEKKNRPGKSTVVDGRARYVDQNGLPVHIIHPRHGWSLVAPADADTVNRDKKLQYLAISNPEAHYYAIKHNDARDSLQANQEAENAWLVQLAPFALGALFLVLLGVGYLVYRFAG